MAEQLTLYTIPSNVSKPGGQRLPHRYERIVGIDTSTAMHRTKIDFPRNPSTQKLTVPKEFSERLTSFFTRFLTDNRDPLYNCHRFAYWMLGDQKMNWVDGFLAAARKVDRGQARVLGRDGAPLGSHVIVYDSLPNEIHPSALHSGIGLGEKRRDFLQVVDKAGYLALDSFDRVQRHYAGMVGHNVDILVAP